MTVKPISVLIPTANQPLFLKMALQSVARQTAVDRIEEILVSENLMNRESEAVCKQFKNLPIRYILQDPPISVSQHYKFLFRQAQTDLIAFLCDDDWWGPGHLELAHKALLTHHEAEAWASNSLHLPGNTLWTGMTSRSPILWLVAGRPTVCEPWCLASHQVLAAAWIVTPFHASSMVVRKSAVQDMIAPIRTEHPYQDDRMWQVQLGLRGMFLYEPTVDTYVRSHGSAQTWQYARSERDAEFRKCTATIEELCAKRGIDLVSLWKTYLAGIDSSTLEEVGRLFRLSLGDKELRARGFAQFVTPHPVMRLLNSVRTITKNRWTQYKPIIFRSLGLIYRQARD
jgi:glycosyltransferase involved in cell wall biosynthesis